MPNVWTHLIFGQEVLKRVDRSRWLAAKESRNLFHLGCQGPDPLLYHHFLPWKRDRRVARLGDMLHEERCGLFLTDMLRQLAGCGEEEPRFRYAAGFLLHHVLDRNAHPYIYVKSGFKPWNHQRFEVALDSIAAFKLRGIEAWRTPVWRELWLAGGVLPEEVAGLLHDLAGRHYPEAYAGMGPAQWQEAYGDMLAAFKLFHDPYGIKRLATLGRIDPFVYKRKYAPLDYCNEAGAVWHDPVEAGREHRTSFWDHWEAALDEGEKLVRLALQMSAEPGAAPSPAGDGGTERPERPEEELARLLGNVSYCTGRACGQYEIRYVDPIL